MRRLRAWLLRVAARWSGRRAGAVLVYHRLAEEAGSRSRDVSPATSVAAFERSLAHLRRCYRLVPAREIRAAAARRRRGDRFPVAITFDDDLASHRRHALPALSRAGAPATFFLCGETLEGPAPAWWDDLDAALAARALTPEDLAPLDEELARAAIAGQDRAAPRLAGALEQLRAGERDALAARLRAAAGGRGAEEGLRADDVRALADSGCEIGFHTRRHYLLSTLPDDELAAALHDGRDRLADAVGRPLDLLAYPHGKAGAREAAAARAAGFAAAFTGSARAVTPESDPMLTSRLEAPQEPGDLALQLARVLLRADG